MPDTSEASVDDAVRTEISKTANTIRKMNWFEVMNECGQTDANGMQFGKFDNG